MRIWRSPQPSFEVPDRTITDHVLGRAERLGGKPALIDGPSGRAVSYGELREAVRSLAGGLAERGVGPGTTWALMAPNLPEYAVVFHGLAAAGATITTLNPTYGAEEIAFQLRDSGASAIVTVEAFLGVARAAAAAVGVRTVVVIGPGDGIPLRDLFGTAGPAPDLSSDQVVALPYSSGTTGFPKGVMLTHRNLVANVEQIARTFQLDDDEVVFAVLPFFHIYGMQVLMNFMLARGLTIVTAPRFDLGQMLELVQRHRISRLYLVPPIVLALAKHPLVDRYDLSSVRQIFSGAAPLDGDLAQAAATRLGCTVAQGYGMTELSPVSHTVPEGDYRPGSVGVLAANTEARLVDPTTGADAEDGGTGELWVRGPQVMKGYLNNPEATAATIDADGWLHTGDVARIDPDGHTYIVDRLKELIKVKGFQVAPAELEALLLRHPAVADAAVIGVLDEESGELPRAFVVRMAGAEVTAQELMDFVVGHVAHYKRLRDVVFVGAIPKSASGKILRRELRAL